jgi:phosphatidate cytidylyltransferase
MAGDLTRRAAVAAVGIPLALVVIHLGGWALAILLAAIAAGSAAELFRLARQRGITPLTAPGLLFAVVLVLIAAAAPTAGQAAAWSWGAVVAGTLLIAAMAIFARGVSGGPLGATAVTVLGGIFTGGTLAHALLLRQMAAPATASAQWVGFALLLFPLVLTWTSDTAAYFGGRSMGRHKLIPSVSPAKTVEGAASGVVGTVIVGAVYGHFVLGQWLGLPAGAGGGALMGLVVSPVAQLGDLAESLLKREAGVKDSGTLLPGHGGLLDRFDSLFFSVPVTYWLLVLLIGGGAG